MIVQNQTFTRATDRYSTSSTDDKRDVVQWSSAGVGEDQWIACKHASLGWFVQAMVCWW